ncbi:hypothetical protein BDBG_16796 [Blastomyces gilchristii SLH14081]|uniref:Uncharacterized protein n=1 Tax=Blastomyces gilchristii (strain SLH14081) TaxID=559298 RepID=A0A179ULG9_BLAGS|nr:uncharacterized protein BDBG_16796 [Blastomyces gilchristii SLH14081]OAT07252.1 hypothetical protein BDBG_16796 [Blastomyces gilchristii SLH14081]
MNFCIMPQGLICTCTVQFLLTSKSSFFPEENRAHL